MTNKISRFLQFFCHLLLKSITRWSLPLSNIVRTCSWFPPITIFITYSSFAFVLHHFLIIMRTEKFVILSNWISLGLVIFSMQHMLQISDLLSILPKLHILKILYFFLSENKLILTTLIRNSKFLLEMLYLLYKILFILQPLLQYHILLPLSLQIKLQQKLIILHRMLKRPFHSNRINSFKRQILIISPQHHR